MGFYFIFLCFDILSSENIAWFYKLVSLQRADHIKMSKQVFTDGGRYEGLSLGSYLCLGTFWNVIPWAELRYGIQLWGLPWPLACLLVCSDFYFLNPNNYVHLYPAIFSLENHDDPRMHDLAPGWWSSVTPAGFAKLPNALWEVSGPMSAATVMQGISLSQLNTPSRYQQLRVKVQLLCVAAVKLWQVISPLCTSLFSPV
jgi:hypothetical protein